MKTKSVILTAVCATALGGCAELNSISRVKPTPNFKETGAIYTVDAKQRHLIVNRNSKGGLEYCAEAAPDVFSAFATSAAAEGSKSGGQFGLSSSETAATIERTQTINLLRESFYRTCERYASGALTKAQFVIQSARDQRTMATIMAIEQLTGAIRPPSTIISGPGTQANAFSGSEAADLVKDYRERRDKAEGKRDAQKKKVENAEKSGGICDPANTDKAEECTELRAELSATQSELDKAQSGLDNAVSVAASLTQAASSSTLTGTNSSTGVAPASINGYHMARVASAVAEIHRSSSINEALMFCLSVLSSDGDMPTALLNPETLGLFRDTCGQVILRGAEFERKTQLALAVGIPGGPEGAARILDRYLRVSLQPQELNRRLGLARQVLGAGSTDSDVAEVHFGDDFQAQAALVQGLIGLETDQTGRTDLGVSR